MCSPDTIVVQDIETPVEEKKKQLPGSSVWETFFSWGVYYLHINPVMKIIYYIITLLIFSLMKESMDIPHFEILTGKQSVLNKMFVKKGWGITCVVFVLYQLVSLTLHTKWKASLKKLLVRAVATTFFFFIWCAVIFQLIENYTQACTYRNIRFELTKKECHNKADHVYHSFDISGHSYLLTYCVLIMMEESKEIVYFLCLRRYLRGAHEDTVEEVSLPVLEAKEAKRMTLRLTILSPIVVIVFMCVVLLCLLWDFMLIVTTIYYHTFLEKVIGTTLAVSMWYMLYRRSFLCIFRYNIFNS
ncbi:acyl-coenzyme A diphosphatase FITM2-like isoform X2 [Panulirus ornatus]